MAETPKNPGRPASNGLPEKAYRVIREHILQGRFTLGSPISRRRLAAEMKMSIIPVSDAIQRLVQEGLIESKPQVGTRIRIPTETDVRDRYIIREALESQASRLCAERATIAERRELREMAAELDELYKERYANPENLSLVLRMNTAHVRLHMRISECSGSTALCRLIETNDVLFYNWMFDLVGEQPPVPARFHSDLMTAICSTDVAAADAAMRAHVRYNLEATIQSVRRISAQVESAWRLGRAKTANANEKALLSTR
jgi:GntR family transcriptional regulator, rspAB operon transcriptional repressor